MSQQRWVIPPEGMKAARDAWHAHYCGEDRGCVTSDHCAGEPDGTPLRLAILAAAPFIRKSSPYTEQETT